MMGTHLSISLLTNSASAAGVWADFGRQFDRELEEPPAGVVVLERGPRHGAELVDDLLRGPLGRE